MSNEPSMESWEAARITRALAGGLRDNLLKPRYRRQPHRSWLEGHCYVMSEALYHLWGKYNGFRPHQMVVGDVSHWFLKHEDGTVWDPTAGQFSPKILDYSKARPRPFLTQKPSKRTQELLHRIGLAP